MSWTLAELRTEVFGPYSYMNDGGTQAARVDRFINQAYQEICAQAPWPFLEYTATGTAPLSISDLATVIAVVDSDGVTLEPISYESLRRIVNGDLTETGTAVWHYLTDGTVVNVYPVPADSITVRYRRVPAALSSSSDSPLIPDEYLDIIALGALRRAALDNQAWEAANGYRQEWDARLLDMVAAEIAPPRAQQFVAGSEDQ